MRRNKYIICILVFLLLFSACAPKAERVSDEELKALRKQYPYNDATSEVVDGVTPQQAYPDFDAWIYRGDPFIIHAVVVLEPEGEWHVLDSTVDVLTHDAKIKEALWTKGNLKAGDKVALGLGPKFASYGMELEKTYVEGEKLVCILFEPYKDHGVPNYFQTAKEYTLYLTKDDVLLSVSSAGGPDSVSGMYLHAFEKLINEALAK